MNTTVSAKPIPVALPYVGPEEEQALISVLRSGWMSQGPRVAEFEKKFAEYVGATHAVAVSSCTTALHLVLVAAGIKPGDEVICPSLSFIATANAIVHAGARPVFVDIDGSTFNLDPNRVEAAITARTRAILTVHQVGLPCALAELGEIAARHNLTLIEDAACAVGSEYRGARIGKPHSAMACFSFHPRKILATGEGGMITTSDANLASHLRKLRQHAMSVSDLARHSAQRVTVETYDEVGYNYRMTDFQAAIGIVQLQRLDEMLARRRWLSERYSQQLAEIDWLISPTESDDCRHNFQSYMVRLDQHAPITRDGLMQELLDRGIATRRGVMASHRELPYRNSNWEKLLPQTNLVADSTIVFPLFHSMKEEDQAHVIDCLKKIHVAATLTPAY